jgi:hypothetical protein
MEVADRGPVAYSSESCAWGQVKRLVRGRKIVQVFVSNNDLSVFRRRTQQKRCTPRVADKRQIRSLE